MESKKYSFLIGILCLFASALSAQDGTNQIGTNYNVLDSSVISNKRLPQFNEFRNNAYPFPPKPRNQWEIGVKGGLFNINGDVPSVFPGGAFGIHVRKALGYVFSLRLDYMYGTAKGLNWKPRTAGFSSPVVAAGYTGNYYDNYKSKVQDLSLDGVVTLNNINFHKAKSNFVVYAMAGVGLTVFDAKVNVKNGATNYSYAGISGGNIENKKDTRDALKNLMDDSYETDGETNGTQQKTFMGGTLKPSANIGLGVAFRLGKRINLAIEDRFTYVTSDLLDGQRWQNVNGLGNSRILTPSNDTYNYFSVGLNFNIGKKSVEPLWWINPLDYAYSELNTPKHMKFPKPVLDDADGDGITDQFDREPNSPSGAPVDAHGVSRDTDGDGVPDYKDKELITPTQCQPVDADGVGKCPEPACCQTLDSLMKAGWRPSNCNLGNLPSVSFTGRTITLSNDAKAVLATLAQSMKNSPDCKVAVIGYGESNKSAQQLSWDRVNTVINHLVEKEGISTDRFIFKYGEAGGDPNTVDIREATSDDTPNSAPAPHPNLRKKK